MINITGSNLTINDLVEIARFNKKIKIDSYAQRAMERSYQITRHLAKSNKLIYGINTGFGIFANKKISISQNKNLNRNLIYSHAVATGEPLSVEITRSAMAVRINALAKGMSGVNPKLVQTLMNMLNVGVIPQISSKGSLGSSGDLCLLAQLGIVFIKDTDEDESNSGYAMYNGNLLSGKEAMQKAGISRISFSYKDGLALINGATFSAAITALCTADAKALIKIANAAEALSLEALCGRSEAFHLAIHEARGIQGQIDVAESIKKLIKGSTFINSHNHVQDAYSLRCAPQVHGAVCETIRFVEGIINKEINAATDNPLVIDEEKIISGGNFHGEPVGLTADFLSIAVTELGAISERRIFRLMDKSLNNGLPEMLVDGSAGEGLNSGLMLLQYTAAALALENQTLASPDSIKSLPTSANQEDHNANAFNAAMNLLKIVENTTKILAIELYTSARGIDLRKKISKSEKLGVGTEQIYQLLRKKFPYNAEDMQWRKHLEPLYALLIKESEFKDKILSTVN
ncbi:MAG: histidine ammonia-lyase [Anaerolineaceae bacterium]|nr:histidine ammonia-lyase [Anaerolineaceae bacterium]